MTEQSFSQELHRGSVRQFHVRTASCARVVGLDIRSSGAGLFEELLCDLALSAIDSPLHGLANVAGVPGNPDSETIMRISLPGLRQVTRNDERTARCADRVALGVRGSSTEAIPRTSRRSWFVVVRQPCARMPRTDSPASPCKGLIALGLGTHRVPH